MACFVAGELKHALDITQPKIIFVSETVLDAVLNTAHNLPRENIIVFGDGIDGTTPFIKFLEISERRNDELIKTTYNPSEHTALILLSSGTTGLPKCVMITDENMRSSFAALK